MLKALISGLALIASAHVANAETTATAPAPGTMPDTQIAKVLLTINEGEVELAKLGKKQAQNREVRDFANMMVDQHEKSSKEIKEVAKKNAIKPEDSAMVKTLKEEAKTAEKDLKRQEKTEFDRAYIRQQVVMHEKALATLRDTLVPQAQNADFKAHLEKTQAAVSQHLDHAKALESKLQ